MKLQYVKADPSGNTTLFVLSSVAPEQRSSLAAKLLKDKGVDAEQVAYLSMVEGQPLRVDMMGGEFCGNASRSAAAYALQLAGGDSGEYAVSCSGCDGVLQAQAKNGLTAPTTPISRCPCPCPLKQFSWT